MNQFHYNSITMDTWYLYLPYLTVQFPLFNFPFWFWSRFLKFFLFCNDRNANCDWIHATLRIRTNSDEFSYYINEKQMQFSPNRLSDGFFGNVNNVIQYLDYQKSIMILSDLFKSNTTISGLPCMSVRLFTFVKNKAMNHSHFFNFATFFF